MLSFSLECTVMTAYNWLIAPCSTHAYQGFSILTSLQWCFKNVCKTLTTRQLKIIKDHYYRPSSMTYFVNKCPNDNDKLKVIVCIFSKKMAHCDVGCSSIKCRIRYGECGHEQYLSRGKSFILTLQQYFNKITSKNVSVMLVTINQAETRKDVAWMEVVCCIHLK